VHTSVRLQAQLFRMKWSILILVALMPCLQALCFMNKCSRYWSGAGVRLGRQNACAVIFDQNCCKESSGNYVIRKNEQGKLCGLRSGLNPLSSCKGSGLKDDVESLLVMPGCRLEVWDHGSGLTDAIAEERKGFNQGDYKNMKDMYKRNKLVFNADRSRPHWVEEINDDFDDMDDDIESFRCTCL